MRQPEIRCRRSEQPALVNWQPPSDHVRSNSRHPTEESMVATYHAGLSLQNVVVIGNGMVGHRFCERLVESDTERRYRIITFCEEPRAAYDRVGLTSFFAHRDAEKLLLARQEWYAEHGVELHVGDRAASIDRRNRIVRSDKGVEISYSRLVLATGSFPF